MNLSFNDEESFKEAAGSLRFNNPSSVSDTSTVQQIGSHSSWLPQDSERNEDICLDKPTSDPNTAFCRMGSTSSSISPQERSENTY